MRRELRMRLWAFVCGVLFVSLCGVTTPALASETSMTTGNLDDAYITKVLSLKEGVAVSDSTNDKHDSYEFTFSGYGTVGANLMSGGVQQVSPLAEGDTVPKLGDENGVVTISAEGVSTPSASDSSATAHQNNGDASTYVYVIRQSLKDIVTADGVSFPVPGVYTYRVTETKINKVATGASVGVTQSKASYLMMVTVKRNDNNENVPVNIDVLKEKDDEGNTNSENGDVYPQFNQKVDPSYPHVDESDANLISTQDNTENIAEADLLPDSRGRNVYGFTFANEYVLGAQVNIKKEVLGDFGNASKEFNVSITFEDPAAPDHSRYVYQVMKREKNTGDDSATNPWKWTAGSKQGTPFNNHKATVSANLKDGDYIEVIGLQGYYIADNDHGEDYDEDTSAEAFEPGYSKRDWFGDGVVPNTTYTVTESGYANYRAVIYTFTEGDASTITSATTAHNKTTAATGNIGEKTTTSNLTTSSVPMTVLVANTFDDSGVNPTGIFINNLPYIIMVGVPLGVFAIMFISRRRSHDDAAS